MNIKIFNDILPEYQALYLEQEIYNTPEHWWQYALRFSNNSEPCYVGNSLAERQKTKHMFSQVEESLCTNLYAYRWKRSMPHVEGCSCYECTFKQDFLLSEEFLSFIVENSELTDPFLFESFVSVYDRGDFLSSHKDQNRGVAFIFNLTRHWRPEYGGMLHVLEKDGTYKAIVPEFNSLVLIDLNEGEGHYHFVSEVSAYAPHPRIAISGWYNEKS